MHLFSSKAVAAALFSPAEQKLRHCDMSLLWNRHIISGSYSKRVLFLATGFSDNHEVGDSYVPRCWAVSTVECLLTFREEHSAFIFRVSRKTFLNCLVPKMEELGSFGSSGTIYQPTQPRVIQNDFSLQWTHAWERQDYQWRFKYRRRNLATIFSVQKVVRVQTSEI